MRYSCMKQLVVASILACAAVASAQAAPVATLLGTISDPVNHHVLSGAEIEIRSGAWTLHTHTNERGQFAIVGVPAGRLNVEVSAIGYEPITIPTCALPEEVRSLPLLVLPQLKTISDSHAAQAYFDKAYRYDVEVARGPNTLEPDEQYVKGLCGA